MTDKLSPPPQRLTGTFLGGPWLLRGLLLHVEVAGDDGGDGIPIMEMDISPFFLHFGLPSFAATQELLPPGGACRLYPCLI